MVDAPRFVKLGTYWTGAEDHLDQADIVVLNKLDQIDTRQADLIERRIKAVNSEATVVRAVHADVQIDRILRRPRGGSAAMQMEGKLKNSAAGYQSGSFKILRPFDPVRLEAWLKRFQRSVIRMKGFVKVHGQEGFHELQWVMGSLVLTPYSGRRPSQAMVVVIGRRIPWQRFLEGLETCLVGPSRRTKRRTNRQTKRWSGAARRTS
jgi:G3E family GTPase